MNYKYEKRIKELEKALRLWQTAYIVLFIAWLIALFT